MNIRSTLRDSARFLRRNRNVIRFKLAGRDLHVAFVRSIGMFAQINFCLYMARYVESSGQRLHITLNSENYRIRITDQIGLTISSFTKSQNAFPHSSNSDLG